MLWRNAVGARIAERTAPDRIRDGTLLVRVRSSAWAQELTHQAPLMVQRLRALGVQLTQLRFVVGELGPIPPSIQRQATIRSPEPAPLPPALQQRLGELDDEELRTRIEQAARYSLARPTTSNR